LDLIVADVLYQDHPSVAPGQPADPSDEEPFIPIDESGAVCMTTELCSRASRSGSENHVVPLLKQPSAGLSLRTLGDPMQPVRATGA
jgi:hypothetical protein